MLGLIMIIASVVIMSRVAEAEDRSGLLWGAITLLLCLACGAVITWPFINIGIGLAISFGAMFAVNVIQG